MIQFKHKVKRPENLKEYWYNISNLPYCRSKLNFEEFEYIYNGVKHTTWTSEFEKAYNEEMTWLLLKR